MNGLLKNNFYGMIENVKIAIVFVLILGITLLISGNDTILNIFCIISTPAIAILSLSCLRKESASKWQKYKLTLPITRNAIVNSQYISHIILCLTTTAIISLFIILTVCIHGNQYFYYGFRDVVTLLMTSFVLSILIGAISYPLCYLWGAERIEVITVFSVIGAVAIVLGLSLIINLMFDRSSITNTIYYISLASILVITLVIFILSKIASCIIFKRKEY